MADPKRKLFFGLFIFPLVIAVGMALLLCVVVFMTSEKETPEILISAIKTGSESKRWQKAYELSNEINRSGKKNIRNAALIKEIVYIFGDSNRYDSKTRGYMALALSHFLEPELKPIAMQALEKGLSDESEDVRLYSTWSIGVLGDKKAAPTVRASLFSDSPQMRKVSAYVLGIVGSDVDVPALENLLHDRVPDVQWNAALSLARLGKDSGLEVLLQMLDRKTFENQPAMVEQDIERVMINAVKGLALIQNPKSITILQLVSKQEKNLRVRQAALDALFYFGKHSGK